MLYEQSKADKNSKEHSEMLEKVKMLKLEKKILE